MYGMRAFKKAEEKKKDKIHPVIHAALLFYQTTEAVFFTKGYILSMSAEPYSRGWVLPQ